MSTEAAVFAAITLLLSTLAVMQALAGNLINAMQLEIFALLSLQLYHFEITKSMIRRVRKE